MEKKDWKKKLRELSFMKGYYFKLEDNGLVEKKDDQLVFNRKDLEDFISSEIEKERKKLVSDINNTLKESIENNESVSKVIEKIDIKVFDVDESSTIRIDMVNMVNSELDKAREEGRIETLKEVEYALEEGIRYKHGIRFTEIQEVLSKLKDNYLTTQEGIEGFISELEKEAERRGLEKALGFIIREGNINWAKDKIVESIKLLKDNK